MVNDVHEFAHWLHCSGVYELNMNVLTCVGDGVLEGLLLESLKSSDESEGACGKKVGLAFGFGFGVTGLS